VALYHGPHIQAAAASRWQRMGDLIGSGFEPYTSRTRSSRLTTTCTIWPVFSQRYNWELEGSKYYRQYTFYFL